MINSDYALKLLSRSTRNDIYITPMVGNKVYRKQFLLENKMSFLHNNCYEDDVFTFISFVINPKVVLVSGTQQHYRQRENSITHSFSKKTIDDLIEAFLYLKNFLIDNKIFDEYKSEYESFFERCISTTYKILITTGVSTQEKKQYLLYLLERVISKFTLKAIVNYLDLNRVHKFLGIDY